MGIYVMNKKGKRKIKKTVYNILLMVVLLSLATCGAFVLHSLVPENIANVTLIYTLALILIARFTESYAYSLITTIFCVVAINYYFTYPYFKFNFTLSGYPITFLVISAISLIISTLTIHLKIQGEMLAENEKKLMEAEKEKMRANLLRAISHDLRTPLTSIIGSASTYIENKNDFKEEEKLELIQKINDDANWLLNMVENLLSVTRIQNNMAKVTKSSEVVEEVVSEAVIRLKKRLPNAEVKVEVPTDFLMIPMDAMLIEQVLINLLENSIVHSQSPTPTELKVWEDEDYVVFSVKDNGIGINEEKVNALLDGMPINDYSSGDKKKGMGIGLSICKTIVLAHQGEIFARNIDKGTEFVFKLPKEDNEKNI